MQRDLSKDDRDNRKEPLTNMNTLDSTLPVGTSLHQAQDSDLAQSSEVDGFRSESPPIPQKTNNTINQGNGYRATLASSRQGALASNTPQYRNLRRNGGPAPGLSGGLNRMPLVIVDDGPANTLYPDTKALLEAHSVEASRKITLGERWREGLSMELKGRMHDLEAQKKEIIYLTQKNRSSEKHIEKLMHDNDVLKQMLEENRNQRFQSNPSMSSKRPSISMRDLKRKVEELNEEILQVTASVSDGVLHEVPHELSKQDVDRMYAHVEDMIGQPLADTLAKEARRSTRTGLKAPNAFLVDTILQVFTIHICFTIIDEWAPSPQISAFMDGLYLNVHRRRSSADSNDLHLWRAMTRENITIALEQDNWDGGSILKSLRIVFTVARWRWLEKDASITFEKKFDYIVKLARDIRLAIDTVPSTLLRVVTVPPNTKFAPGWMADALIESKDSELPRSNDATPQRVIGTLGLGLKKLIEDVRTELSYESILPPTVFLESDLHRSVSSIDSWMCGKS